MRNLKRFSRDADILVLWLDCDREGEAIAYDVMEVCLQSRGKKNLECLRAHFSALTSQQINDAMCNLTAADKNLADAVKLR